MTHSASLSPFPLQARQVRRLLIGTLGSVATLGWVLRGVDLSDLSRALLTLSPGWFVASLGCALVGALTKTARWRTLYGSAALRTTFGELFSTLMLSQAANVFIPIRLGELIRIGLMRKAGQASATTLSTILIEKALDLMAAGLVALSLFAFSTAPAWAQEPAVGIALVGLMITLGIPLLWLGRSWLEKAIAGLGRVFPAAWHQRFQQALHQMVTAFSNLTGWRVLIEILFWTLIIWIFSILSIISLFFAFSLPLRLEAVIIMTLAANFSNIAPSPGLVGVVPVVAVIILDYFAVSQSVALGYGLALNLVMVGPLLILGGWSLWYRATSLMELLIFQKQLDKS